MKLKRSMRLGNKICLVITILFLIPFNSVVTEDKIVTSPLINVEQIKPSFEELVEDNENISTTKDLKKKNNKLNLKSSQAILIGLDKITAKSSKLVVNLNETKIFGPLEIKILKCGKVKVNNKTDSVAYLQVKEIGRAHV